MENSGMARFIKCIDLFPDDKDLLFFIFGTLSNVSECDLVNGKLIAKDYIQRMVKHLNQQAYGYTICGFVADILTNIAAIDITQWPEDLSEECKRDFVLGKIKTEISAWKVNFDLCFQFNSLAPLIKLIKPNIPADCYILPVWRLANCTRVESSQYCPMLEKEGGLQVLEDLIKRSDVMRDIKMLAALTLYQCELARTDRAASDKLKTSESTQGCRKVVKLEDLIQHTAICEHNEANLPKTCDVCYCDKTRDHDCVDAILEAKCSANDETDLLTRTVRELKTEESVRTARMFQSEDDGPQEVFRPTKHMGLIESFGTVTIAVSLQPVYIDNLIGKNKHKFMVQTMFAPEGAVNQETLWEGVNPEAIMTSKLKCVFDVTPPSNETPVR
ncbi:unnamed protein product [Oppiella nova]|uniref:Protein zer-1 homolog-like C-terminal domain-containing protein n=1 Tax=Oppiella nova TaxID=334625 RepID=A0A7R9QU59_9ACAR|nr:unnamed protein product [Oppiella nova]CAG2175765.1 unnamed protein product [Oppiella nova]